MRLDPQQIRRLVLEESHRAKVGHIGSCLCVCEILAALYSEVIDVDKPEDSERERFVLSKGHAGLALYATLHLRGWLSREGLAAFLTNGSSLGVHPDRALPGIDFSTGSLGMGLSFAVGSSLAARLAGSARRTFALLSDAECNEGAIWEAAMFAAHHRLPVVAIVDCNGQQALDYTRNVLDLEPMGARWQSFGWEVVEVDGHDMGALTTALTMPRTGAIRPRVVLARTVFGRGVSFMEGKVAWHYLPMDDDQFARALADVGGGQ